MTIFDSPSSYEQLINTAAEYPDDIGGCNLYESYGM